MVVFPHANEFLQYENRMALWWNSIEGKTEEPKTVIDEASDTHRTLGENDIEARDLIEASRASQK